MRRQRKQQQWLSKSSFFISASAAVSCCSSTTVGVDTDALSSSLSSRKRRLLLRGRGGNSSSEEHKHRSRSRTLQQVSSHYLSTHPFYPSHELLSCTDDGDPPSWMTWAGGYAENHLFPTQKECCDKWFPDSEDCWEDEGQEIIAAMGAVVQEDTEVINYHTRPVATTETTTTEQVLQEQEAEQEPSAGVEMETSTTTDERPRPTTTTTSTTTIEQEREDTFPTSACGTDEIAAQQCTRLCLSGGQTDCAHDEKCFPHIHCPAGQVAHAMGAAGEAILHHIALPDDIDEKTDTVNVCGVDYDDAESKCIKVTNEESGLVEYHRTEDIIECSTTSDGGTSCPNDMICYGGILCPLVTESPTGMPITSRPTTARPTSSTTVVVASMTTSTTAEKDKAEVVGIAIMPIPPPSPPDVVTASTTTSTSLDSPYSIDQSTLGTISVASDSCIGGCPSDSTCVGNTASGQLITDTDCEPCASGQTWWPCDIDGLCWCWKDGTDRIAPAPSSGLQVESTIYEKYGEYYTPCDDILSRELFAAIAPHARYPYTYTGLCDAILTYNAQHTEKAFGMGDAYIRASELAAFLGNTLHESDEYKAPREYLMCGDHKIGASDGEVYCKPCDSGSYDWVSHTCAHSLALSSSNGAFSEYCQPSSKPPEACDCSSVKAIDSDGYVPAKLMYFGRGAIQLSWNYNYRGASTALTGTPDTFCENPDLVATVEKYAWGAGLYFWMEHNKEGTTSHIESVKKYNFGGTLNNINGGLECPAHGGWHEEAVKLRLNRYCRAVKALGLPNLLRLDGCAGLEEKFQHCVADGSCSDCHDFYDKNPGEHSYTYSPPAFSPTTATTVVEQPAVTEEKPKESLCPEGLIPWEKNPSCCVPNPNFIGDGACDPDAPYNTAECNYDGGDCCKETCDRGTIFGCTTKENSQFGAYGPFGYYCIDPSQEDSIDPSKCSDVVKDSIGDGRCNPEYNSAECNWDGGDCCEDSCDNIHSYFQCGSGVQSFVCLDPAFFKEAETDHPTHRPSAKPTAALTKAPTVPPTKTPTPLPTKAITTSPTESKAAVTPPPSVAPTNVPTKVPSKAPTTSPTSHCHKDMLECDGGTFVSRNPDNNCEFFPCPELTNTESSLANGSPTPRPTEDKTTCKEDWLECSGGQFVFRNPDDSCNFWPCPEPEQSRPTPRPTEQIIYMMAGTIHEKLSTSSSCNAELFKCPDGRYVGRDAENGCEYFPCKQEEEQIYTMSSAVMTHEKLTSNEQQFRTHDKRRKNSS